LTLLDTVDTSKHTVPRPQVVEADTCG